MKGKTEKSRKTKPSKRNEETETEGESLRSGEISTDQKKDFHIRSQNRINSEKHEFQEELKLIQKLEKEK